MPCPSQQTGVSEIAQPQTETATVTDADTEEHRQDARAYSPVLHVGAVQRKQQDTQTENGEQRESRRTRTPTPIQTQSQSSLTLPLTYGQMEGARGRGSAP